jgi:hypothetical protein
MRRVERHHWLNTVVGILDSAFYLSDVEQVQVIAVVRDLLTALRIPERGDPEELPAPLALEVHSNYYTVALSGPRDSGVTRTVRRTNDSDLVVSLEAWRDALTGLFAAAYPELAPFERLTLAKVLSDLLAALGIPERAAAFFPHEVVNAYNRLPESRVGMVAPAPAERPQLLTPPH